MVKDLVLAWAMPVDEAILGPQVEAYSITIASLTTIRCCIRHAGTTGLARVPYKVREMIEDKPFKPVYKPKHQKWLRLSKCLAGDLSLSNHITASDYKCS